MARGGRGKASEETSLPALGDYPTDSKETLAILKALNPFATRIPRSEALFTTLSRSVNSNPSAMVLRQHQVILGMLEVVSRSEPGRGRVYEDRVLVDEGRGLFAVADGVTRSSQGTGAAAADLAVKLLSENFTGDLE